MQVFFHNVCHRLQHRYYTEWSAEVNTLHHNAGVSLQCRPLPATQISYRAVSRGEHISHKAGVSSQCCPSPATQISYRVVSCEVNTLQQNAGVSSQCLPSSVHTHASFMCVCVCVHVGSDVKDAEQSVVC